MDIVSRLRQFMEYRKIPITQFADTCGIPRPTLSQLLNGRNKKVSDELIGKIHEAYPALSVMWLMFGEGSMLSDSNMRTSEPQNVTSIDFNTPESAKDEHIATGNLFDLEIHEKTPEKFRSANHTDEAKTKGPHLEIAFTDTPSSEPGSRGDSENKPKVSHIIVYYSDNTYETFVPRQ